MAIQNPTSPQNTGSIFFKGNRFAAFLLHLSGWKYFFNGLPGNVGVVMAYPHTSNWDFPVGLLYKLATGMPVKFLIKDIFFKIPVVRQLMAYWGGVPVDRSQSHGLSEHIAAQIRNAQQNGTMYWLAIAPEGTRKYMPYMRSGFYHIALAAGAPLGLACFNYRDKIVQLTEFITLTGDEELDVARINAYYAEKAIAYHPTQAGAIFFRKKTTT